MFVFGPATEPARCLRGKAGARAGPAARRGHRGERERVSVAPPGGARSPPRMLSGGNGDESGGGGGEEGGARARARRGKRGGGGGRERSRGSARSYVNERA